MMDADPANAELYKENARKLVNEMADLHRELKEKLAPLGGLKVVTYHKAWDYFADAFGINIVGAIEPKVGITPSPADIKRTIELMKREGVKVVIVETYNSLARGEDRRRRRRRDGDRAAGPRQRRRGGGDVSEAVPLRRGKADRGGECALR